MRRLPKWTIFQANSKMEMPPEKTSLWPLSREQAHRAADKLGSLSWKIQNQLSL